MKTPRKRTPTLAQLIDADRDGLILRNPDNGVVFRAVYVNWQGVLPGVKIYRRNGLRPVRSPLMSHDWIESWLAGLDFFTPRNRCGRIA